MRTYGRLFDKFNKPTGWVVVETDPQGFNDLVWLVTLIQVFKLNLGESPFYANYGIPAKPSVVQQIFPDFYVWQTQQQFAQFFSSLLIAKLASATPTYRVNVTTNQGFRIVEDIPK